MEGGGADGGGLEGWKAVGAGLRVGWRRARVDGAWRFGSGLRFGSRPSCK